MPILGIDEPLQQAIEPGRFLLVAVPGSPRMVGLVYDHEVPASARDLRDALIVVGRERGRADDVVAQRPDVLPRILTFQDLDQRAAIVREDLVELVLELA